MELGFTASGNLLIERCEEGALVFNTATGETTLLNEALLFLLSTIQQQGVVDRFALDKLCGGRAEIEVAQVDHWLAMLLESQLLFHR